MTCFYFYIISKFELDLRFDWKIQYIKIINIIILFLDECQKMLFITVFKYG